MTPSQCLDRIIEAMARILEPQAWRALGLCDTLAYKNRRTSSLRKATAALAAALREMREPTDEMMMQSSSQWRRSDWKACIDHLTATLQKREERG